MRRLGLVTLLVVLYLPALGDPSSGTHPDESYYLGISAEMDQRGAWLTPTIDGEERWFKPPLLYWAQRACYAVLGRGFLAARLPAALSAVALALLTGALARRMYGERAAATAALLCATAFGWLKFGRIAMMDAPMALAFAAAAWGAWRASEEGRPAALLWCGAGAGAAFMLKGPVGAVIVLLLAGGFLALRRPALLASRFTAAAFALGAALGLPWYVASLVVHGRRFYDFFVVQQNLDRFRHPWTLAGEATLLVGLLAFLLPWTPLVLGALAWPRRGAGGSAPRLRDDPGLLLPLVWIAAVLVVFTIPALKWPHYGLGCAPACALLVARAPARRWARGATAAVLALLGAALLAVLRWPLPAVAAAALAGAGVALLVGAVPAARGRLAASAAAVAVAAALVLAVALPAVNPPVIPPGALARLEGRDLYVYDYVPGLFTLAAGRPVHRVGGDSLRRALSGGGVVIASASAAQKLPSELREQLVPVTRWEHIRGSLPEAVVLRSWRERDPALLFEPMLALELPPAARP